MSVDDLSDWPEGYAPRRWIRRAIPTVAPLADPVRSLWPTNVTPYDHMVAERRDYEERARRESERHRANARLAAEAEQQMWDARVAAAAQARKDAARTAQNMVLVRAPWGEMLVCVPARIGAVDEDEPLMVI